MAEVIDVLLENTAQLPLANHADDNPEIVGEPSTNNGHATTEPEIIEVPVANNALGNAQPEIIEVPVENNEDSTAKMVEQPANNGDGVWEIKRAGNSSFLGSVINMSAILIGLGKLSIPYALEKGGWTSAFLLVGFGIMCAYTSHLSGRCLQNKESLKNYSDIGGYAFGPTGKLLSTIFISLEVFMALVSFTIAVHDNLSTIFHGEHHLHISLDHHLSISKFFTIIAVIVALPTVWLKDLSRISFLSTVGIICSLLIYISVVYVTVSGGVEANKTIPVLRLHNFPAISGLYIFSFSTHVVFPDIYRSMKDPSGFPKVSALSFTIVTAFYTTIAFMGAKLYGSDLKSQITLNLPRHLIITKIALWATVIAPITKYAFALVPLASQLYEKRLPPTVSAITRLFVRGSIGSLLLIIVLILALSVPYFEQILGLTGSLVSMGVSIIFPCAFYTKVFRTQISTKRLVLHAIIIVFAVVVGVFGTISSSRSLASKIMKK